MKITCLDQPGGNIVSTEEALELYKTTGAKFIVQQVGAEREIICGPWTLKVPREFECQHKQYKTPDGEIISGARFLIHNGQLVLNGESTYGAIGSDIFEEVVESIKTHFGLPTTWGGLRIYDKVKRITCDWDDYNSSSS